MALPTSYPVCDYTVLNDPFKILELSCLHTNVFFSFFHPEVFFLPCLIKIVQNQIQSQSSLWNSNHLFPQNSPNPVFGTDNYAAS